MKSYFVLSQLLVLLTVSATYAQNPCDTLKGITCGDSVEEQGGWNPTFQKVIAVDSKKKRFKLTDGSWYSQDDVSISAQTMNGLKVGDAVFDTWKNPPVERKIIGLTPTQVYLDNGTPYDYKYIMPKDGFMGLKVGANAMTQDGIMGTIAKLSRNGVTFTDGRTYAFDQLMTMWQSGLGLNTMYGAFYLSTQFQYITQVELYVPAALNFANYMDVTNYWSYVFFELIPHINDMATIQQMRQLAIDVCALYPPFCPTREEIHAFPTRVHLAATDKLYEETKNATVGQLRDRLRQFFAYEMDYSTVLPRLNDTALKNEVTAYSQLVPVTMADTVALSLKINEKLMANATDMNYRGSFTYPLLTTQSYLQLKFKMDFSNLDLSVMKKDLTQAKSLTLSLIDMSYSRTLLSSREYTSLKDQVAAATENGALLEVLKAGIKFQVSRVESLYQQEIFATHKEELTDQMKNVYQEAVRMSLVTEWDKLREALN